MYIRSILITGANRGIGLEFVKQFVALPKPPTHLISTCRSPDEAKELQSIAKAHSNVHVLKLDVLNESSIRTLADNVQRILEGQGLNILLNNAGVNLEKYVALENVTRNAMEQSFSANVVGPMNLCQTLLPLLKAAVSSSSEPGMSVSKAAVINMSSILSSIASVPPGSKASYPYQISKSAVNMLTKLLSGDLQPLGILVMCVHPGWVKTDMGGEHATLTTEQSVRNMLSLFSSLNESSTGKLLDHKGKELPW
ncbi:C-factor-like [Anneissia japonica]|uniref:C-factor-like n=1 Tax=Anneissia japonica TaxID=1529436 RepID=UPI0014257E50|nr:C-factor-like [Anneissia japonica]